MNPFDNLSQSKALVPVDPEVQRIVPGVALNEEQHKVLKEYVTAVKYGISTYSNPMRCRGNECVMISKCPISRASLELPIGKDCPVEKYFVEQKIADLTKDLGINIQDLGSIYDKLLINDLSTLELLEFRASIEMSEDPKIVKREVFGIADDGTPLMTSSVNPVIIFKEKVTKAKMKILEELIATRKSRAEDARANIRDRSSQIAEMLQRAKANATVNPDTVIDAKFTLDQQILDV